MLNMPNENPSNKWLSVPLISTVTRLLCKELTLQNEYLRQENKILKSKLKTRLSFTNDERRTLVEADLAMGKDLILDSPDALHIHGSSNSRRSQATTSC